MTSSPKRPFGRFRRRGPDDEDDSVSIAGDEDHAWWAERTRLSSTPDVGRERNEPRRAEGEGDLWSSESLFGDLPFEEATTDRAAMPDDDGTTTTTAVIVNDLDEAHLLLGVARGTDMADITSAHRTLAKQYHPDLLVALSADARDLGERRMAEINRAYETLQRAYA